MNKNSDKTNKPKEYRTTVWIYLIDQPEKLGDVTTMIGENRVNISSVEILANTEIAINFRLHIIINTLKNFTKRISDLKQQ